MIKDIPVFILRLRRVIGFLHNFSQFFILLYFQIEKMGKQFGLTKKISVPLESVSVLKFNGLANKK